LIWEIGVFAGQEEFDWFESGDFACNVVGAGSDHGLYLQVRNTDLRLVFITLFIFMTMFCWTKCGNIQECFVE
jgi:hypothetical protein